MPVSSITLSTGHYRCFSFLSKRKKLSCCVNILWSNRIEWDVLVMTHSTDGLWRGCPSFVLSSHPYFCADDDLYLVDPVKKKMKKKCKPLWRWATHRYLLTFSPSLSSLSESCIASSRSSLLLNLSISSTFFASNSSPLILVESKLSANNRYEFAFQNFVFSKSLPHASEYAQRLAYTKYNGLGNKWAIVCTFQSSSKFMFSASCSGRVDCIMINVFFCTFTIQTDRDSNSYLQ